MMGKILVVYYSRRGENFMPGGVRFLEKGNTEYAAEYLAEGLGAELFRLETLRDYSPDYKTCCKEAAEEARSNARPELKAYLPDLEGCDAIFLCYPNWCGTAPMCLFTFLEHYHMAGKTLLPLCTNEGSGLTNSVEDIRRACPGATVLPGLSIRGHKCKDSREEILAWAKAALG